MVVLLQLKAASTFQGFVATFMIGEIDEGTRYNDVFEMSKVCLVNEVPVQKRQGDNVYMDVMPNFRCNSLYSNGTINVSKADMLFWRVIEADDEVLNGYRKEYDQFRVNRLNLVKASSISNLQPQGQA